MRTDDQWFEVGDKVMRVGSEHSEYAIACPNGNPEFGKIYCVESFYEGPQFNAIMLVGFGPWKKINGHWCGWQAKAFRKVDEIRLCIAAVQRGSEPVEANNQIQPPSGSAGMPG